MVTGNRKFQVIEYSLQP